MCTLGLFLVGLRTINRGRICYRLRHLPTGNFTIWCHVTGKAIMWVLGRVFSPGWRFRLFGWNIVDSFGILASFSLNRVALGWNHCIVAAGLA